MRAKVDRVAQVEQMFNFAERVRSFESLRPWSMQINNVAHESPRNRVV